jgi:hypothetical protein
VPTFRPLFLLPSARKHLFRSLVSAPTLLAAVGPQLACLLFRPFRAGPKQQTTSHDTAFATTHLHLTSFSSLHRSSFSQQQPCLLPMSSSCSQHPLSTLVPMSPAKKRLLGAPHTPRQVAAAAQAAALMVGGGQLEATATVPASASSLVKALRSVCKVFATVARWDCLATRKKVFERQRGQRLVCF